MVFLCRSAALVPLSRPIAGDVLGIAPVAAVAKFCCTGDHGSLFAGIRALLYGESTTLFVDDMTFAGPPHGSLLANVLIGCCLGVPHGSSWTDPEAAVLVGGGGC